MSFASFLWTLIHKQDKTPEKKPEKTPTEPEIRDILVDLTTRVTLLERQITKLIAAKVKIAQKDAGDRTVEGKLVREGQVLLETDRYIILKDKTFRAK